MYREIGYRYGVILYKQMYLLSDFFDFVKIFWVYVEIVLFKKLYI